jgi:hypothetical protein
MQYPIAIIKFTSFRNDKQCRQKNLKIFFFTVGLFEKLSRDIFIEVCLKG